MKKLLNFSLVFMLAVLFNTNAFAWMSYDITPAPGEVKLDEFSEIRVTFTGISTLVLNEEKTLKVSTRDANGKWTDYYAPNVRIEGTSLVITGMTDVKVGTYGIDIAKQMLRCEYYDYNDEIYDKTLWTVVAGVEPFAFESAVPANNATVNKLEEIVLNFGSESVLTGSATVNIAGVQATFAPTATPGQVKATLPQPIKAEGAYSFTIPENSFTAVDGSYNEAVTVNYTVAIPEMDANSIVVSPAAGANVMDLNTVTIDFPEPISVNEAAGAITFSNGATVENIEIQKYTAIITANAPAGWQLGQYTLNVPKGYFVGENGKNPALSYSWNIIAATLSIDDFVIYSGETKEVAIKLNSEMPFAAFQADVRLPEGLELVGDFQLLRGTDHTFSTRVQKDGSIRLLSYSLTNANYAGNSGDALVKFQVKAAADYNQTRQITIDNIAFTTKEGNEFELDAAAANAEGRLFVSSITIAPEALNLETNETAKVTATVLPENAYSAKFEWSSSNPDIVAIDEEGNVVAKAAGNANIIATATDGSGVTAQIPVTVVYTHATALTITPATVLFEVGNRQTLTATLDKDTNKAADIVWTSNNPEVAEIVITEGVVEVVGKAIGETNVIAQLKNGNEVVLEKTIPVKVDATMATTLAVNPAQVMLETGGKTTLVAVVDDKASNPKISWYVEEGGEQYVSVDENGVVTALAVTPAAVKVYAATGDGSNLTAYSEVTVVATLVENVTIALADPNDDNQLMNTETVRLVANLTGTTNKNIIWTSSDEAMATVEVVEGVAVVTAGSKTGEVTIFATIEGTNIRGEYKLTIIPTPATEIAINYEGATKFETGANQVTLTATVGPELATDKTYTWTSSDEEIATISENGVVTFGEKTGEVVFTAKANGAAEGATVEATLTFNLVYTFAAEIIITSDSDDNVLKAGESLNLTAKTDVETNKTIVWSSDNEAVTVEKGLVTALKYVAGDVTIKAQILNGETAVLEAQQVIKLAITPGDVDNDAIIDVADVTATAAYILGDEVDSFIFDAADLNNSGTINVTDITLMVNIILSQEDEPEAQSVINRARQYADSSNSLFIENFSIAEGETRQIAVMLNNSVAFTAFQADIRLPEGLEIVGADLSERKADHSLAYAVRNNGSVRLLSYSLGLNEYAESNGEFVYLTVKAADNFVGDFQIEIDNVTFVQANHTKYYLEPTVANVAGYTGVEAVEGDQIVVKVVGNTIVAPEGAEVYDLNGLRVNAENLAKGIYIVKVGDQIVKVII